jgi:hypothetical protein
MRMTLPRARSTIETTEFDAVTVRLVATFQYRRVAVLALQVPVPTRREVPLGFRQPRANRGKCS